jgi:hypothetical protein
MTEKHPPSGHEPPQEPPVDPVPPELPPYEPLGEQPPEIGVRARIPIGL